MRKVFKILPILLAFTFICGANAEYSAIVTQPQAAVYADENCLWQIGALPFAAVVSVESDGGTGARIRFGDYTGYMQSGSIVEIARIATRVETNADTRVFAFPDFGSMSIPIPRGMKMNRIAVNGDWAMVENAGITAYAWNAHLREPSAQEEEPVISVNLPVQTAEKTEVFDAPNGKSLGTLPKGSRVTIVAVRGEWALIDRNGQTGCARFSSFAPVEDEPIIEDKTPIFQEKSAEKTIYRFLTEQIGLNTAAACGILANVERECDFRINLTSSDGGYGIVQWTGVRNRNLKNWCKKNDYDYKTLEGQLRFLEYELNGSYSKILKTMKNIENSPAGAYEAAYYFCYNFEIPANRVQNSIRRGNIAKDTYWKRYAG